MKNSRYDEIDLTDFAALVRGKMSTNTIASMPMAAHRPLPQSVRLDPPSCRLADDLEAQIRQALAELKKAIDQFSSSSTVAEFVPRKDRSYSVNELLKYEDRSFIKVAYVAALGRPPDIEGEASYLAHLRNGMPKYQILVHVASSDEGKRYGAKLRGLASIVSLKSWCQVPVIGRLISLFNPALGLNTLECKISMIEGRFVGAKENFLQASINFSDAISCVFVQQVICRKQLQVELNALIARVEEVETFSKLSSGNNPQFIGQSGDDFCRTPRADLDLGICLKSHLQRWRAESTAGS